MVHASLNMPTSGTGNGVRALRIRLVGDAWGMELELL
jgi:hypothetical protein